MSARPHAGDVEPRRISSVSALRWTGRANEGTAALARIVTDLHGRVLEASPNVSLLLAADEGTLPGRPLAAYVAESGRADFRLLLLELTAGGTAARALTLRRPDGVEFDVDLEAASDTNRGRVEWRLAPADDAARLTETDPGSVDGVTLRRLLSRLPIGVVSLNDRLEITYRDAAARVHLGDGMPERSLGEPWPGFSLDRYTEQLFTESPPAGTVVETEDGRLLELDGIPAEGRDAALLLIQDVTAPERRRRAEQEFVANASHELRTPVASIASAVEVLQGGAKENPADRDLFLEHIERESGRLTRLSSSLLLLARVQTGQAVTELAVVDVEPVLEEIAEQVEPSPGVEVHVSGDPVKVLADRSLLCQAVLNLATNAAHHTPRGEIELACREHGYAGEIEVRDTGTGIPEADQARLFDRFVRLEGGTDGFGLGLAITREIVMALGGTVELDSTVGEGTTVRLRLAAAKVVHP